MKFHHVCIMCKDIVSYTRFWTDFMGFKALPITSYPTPSETLEQYGGISEELCDEMFGREGHRTRVTMVIHPDGACVELNCPDPIDVTPPEKLRYSDTGMNELGFAVEDIDAWFEKVRGEGFETTTSAPWSATTGGINRTFLFADPEGNLIQLTQPEDGDYWVSLAPYVVETGDGAA